MIIAIALLLVSLGLFIFSCIIASSDAQGAVVFLFFIPVVLAILGFNIFWTRKKGMRKLNVLSLTSMVFTVFFIVFAFVPGLTAFPLSVMNGVSKGFEFVAGKTPYAYFREKKDIVAKINRDLKDSPESVDMRDYDTSSDWQKVCIFGPYSNDDKVKHVLGFDFKMSLHSSIASNDSIDTLVFVDNKSVAYILDYPRSLADFSKLSGQCFEKGQAVFKASEPKSKVFIYSER